MIIGLVLLNAGDAQAGWRVPRARAVAEVVWGYNPCVTELKIRWVRHIPQGLDPAVVAWASTEPVCEIGIKSDPLTWPELCTYLIHEGGHLAGYRDPTNRRDPRHSSKPNSVMAAEDPFTYGHLRQHGRLVEVGGDPRCADRGRPYLEKHGRLRPHDPHLRSPVVPRRDT